MLATFKTSAVKPRCQIVEFIFRLALFEISQNH